MHARNHAENLRELAVDGSAIDIGKEIGNESEQAKLSRVR